MTLITLLSRELADATDDLQATAARLGDAEVAAPSALPGWSRGHVLTHLSRNAESIVRLLTWARTGEPTPQYPSPETREAEIEHGAGRPAAEQLADLTSTSVRLAGEIASMPASAWQGTVSGMLPPPHPGWYLLVRRIREVRYHHVDLAAGYGPRDWPEPFALRELHDCLACWPYGMSTISEIHLPSPGGGVFGGLGDGPAVAGSAADVLAWLTGRSAGEGVSVVSGKGGPPSPPPWMVTTAPADLPAAPPEEYP
ncbi:maleylpyruvate isomerase family mycothiol-dependent enzyme [Nonomuraea soli]|uniref:Maleylpyruvate isomerase n=1 Tax=Nonomuraea soli TaxID=1032476 RepID=A0A7W0CRJ2_9ACTN|nr:maleylpyruvate isomerase family mycothiol-dependent enzyme [Nonomuraea soli]MBA2895937.1 maleylpyruvate isomerase [Nonomuraea soli]